MNTALADAHGDWLKEELADTLDEDYELELSDPDLPAELRKIYSKAHPPSMPRAEYFRALFSLQAELIKLQDWVLQQKQKVVVLFEGRDAAGKGGVIKRVTQRLNPRIARVVALPAPSDREKTQWYFQRFVTHLPAGGFERMIVGSGIRLIKYWFSITDEEQQMRFLMRIYDPMKQWKLSPMDLQSRVRWEAYTKAKEEMFIRTNIPEAPWFIVEGNDKKRARLNCMSHLLDQIPYEEVPHHEISLPQRLFDPQYERKVLPPELYVPHRF